MILALSRMALCRSLRLADDGGGGGSGGGGGGGADGLLLSPLNPAPGDVGVDLEKASPSPAQVALAIRAVRRVLSSTSHANIRPETGTQHSQDQMTGTSEIYSSTVPVISRGAAAEEGTAPEGVEVASVEAAVAVGAVSVAIAAGLGGNEGIREATALLTRVAVMAAERSADRASVVRDADDSNDAGDADRSACHGGGDTDPLVFSAAALAATLATQPSSTSATVAAAAAPAAAVATVLTRLFSAADPAAAAALRPPLLLLAVRMVTHGGGGGGGSEEAVVQLFTTLLDSMPSRPLGDGVGDRGGDDEGRDEVGDDSGGDAVTVAAIASVCNAAAAAATTTLASGGSDSNATLLASTVVAAAAAEIKWGVRRGSEEGERTGGTVGDVARGVLVGGAACKALAQLIGGGGGAVIEAAGLAALRTSVLQPASATVATFSSASRAAPTSGDVARGLLACVGPAAASGTRLRAATAAAAAAPTSTTDPTSAALHVRAAAEGLKLWAAALQLPSPGDDAGRTAVLAVLLPLVIEAAAPAAPGISAAPPLKQAAVQLITRLAGAAAGPFRTAVGALGAESKARLQAALTPGAVVASTAGGLVRASGVGGRAPPALRLPSIALKSNLGA